MAAREFQRIQDTGFRPWEGVGGRVKKRNGRSHMAIKGGRMRRPRLIVWAVSRDERCEEISPTFPRAMSIGSGMGGRQCGDLSTQGSGSPKRLVPDRQSY